MSIKDWLTGKPAPGELTELQELIEAVFAEENETEKDMFERLSPNKKMCGELVAMENIWAEVVRLINNQRKAALISIINAKEDKDTQRGVIAALSVLKDTVERAAADRVDEVKQEEKESKENQ